MTDPALLIETAWLESPDLEGYELRPISDSVDQRIATLLRDYLRLSPSETQNLTPSLNERRAKTLKAFAERMATQAVRTRTEELVFLGFVALALCSDILDLRDLNVGLAVVYDATERIGCDPTLLVARLKARFPTAVRDLFAPFLARDEDDREIDAMHFVALIRDGAFTYMQFDPPIRTVGPTPGEEYYGPTAEACETVNRMLRLPATGQEQDWENELGDPTRLDDILRALAENRSDLEIRCALGLLAVATIDDAVRGQVLPRFDQIMRLRELVARDERLSRRLHFRFIELGHGLNPCLIRFLL